MFFWWLKTDIKLEILNKSTHLKKSGVRIIVKPTVHPECLLLFLPYLVGGVFSNKLTPYPSLNQLNIRSTKDWWSIRLHFTHNSPELQNQMASNLILSSMQPYNCMGPTCVSKHSAKPCLTLPTCSYPCQWDYRPLSLGPLSHLKCLWSTTNPF